jgi:hypothetical protein
MGLLRAHVTETETDKAAFHSEMKVEALLGK